jgi:molecular chaperone HscB
VVGYRKRQPLFLCLGGQLKRVFMTTSTPATNPPLVCWNCHERTVGTHFCSSCGKVLQMPAHSDYFAMFEMPRKLWIEMNTLEQKFLQLTWKLHPDNFVKATPQERDISLKRGSELNDAYRTLRDPVARVEYLLAIEGARKEGQNKQQAPPELLEEVFELNESLDELREAKVVGGDTASLHKRLETAEKNFESKLSEVDGELQAAAREWDKALDEKADESRRRGLKNKLNDLLNRRSYIRNLVVNVHKELT